VTSHTHWFLYLQNDAPVYGLKIWQDL